MEHNLIKNWIKIHYTELGVKQNTITENSTNYFTQINLMENSLKTSFRQVVVVYYNII